MKQTSFVGWCVAGGGLAFALMAASPAAANDFELYAGDEPLPENWAAIVGEREVIEVPTKVWEFGHPTEEKTGLGPLRQARRQPDGALSGRVVFIGAGHGWTPGQGGADWGTQRPVLLGMVEDTGNIDQMTLFAHYLWNAGATVAATRPIGWQSREVILDQDDTTPGTDGQVVYTGTWSSSSTTPYFGKAPDSAADTYRFADVTTSAPHNTARYIPNIPETATYPVYTWVLQSDNRRSQLYRIRHAGGTTEVRINHRLVGSGAVWLGSYVFEAGSDGYVEISSEAAPGETGGVVIADGIRFGNGMGTRDLGDGPSGFPREEEYVISWQEVMIGTPIPPDTLFTVSGPPRWAAYMNNAAAGDFSDRVYIGFHSNAGGGRGADGLYNRNDLFPGTGTPNQFELADALGREINEDMRQLDTVLFPTYGQWTDTTGHTFARSDFAFGEIRWDSINNEMDATIIEVAFHDNATDTEYLRDVRARRLIARATLQGYIRFLEDVHGESLTMPPDEPTNLRAIGTASGIELSWDAPVLRPHVGTLSGNIGGDPATGYTVYASTNGIEFEPLSDVGGTTTVVAPADPEEPMIFYVTATNAGGESFPSNVAAARGQGGILVVDGFDRIDNFMTGIQTIPSSPRYNVSGDIARVLPNLANSYDYVARYATAIGAYADTLPFSSCTNDAVLDGDVNLDAYEAVFWYLGEESTRDETFSSAEQGLVRTYANGGGQLFVSGGEVGWDLDRTSGPTNDDRQFMADVLRAQYSADDANTYNVVAAGGGIFAGIAGFSFDDGSSGDYDTNFPDVLTTSGTGTTAALNYSGGTGGIAAVQYDGTAGGGKVVYMGFPYETINSASSREQVMGRVLDFLDITPMGGSTSVGNMWMMF